MGWQNLSAPGLYDDEAVYGGLAKDFLTRPPDAYHVPGVRTIEVLGRPFPLFVQPYLGALKCWLLIPAFKIFGATQAVMRGVNLCLGAIALLVCMAWVWRLLGLAEGLLTGLLAGDGSGLLFCGRAGLGRGAARPAVPGRRILSGAHGLAAATRRAGAGGGLCFWPRVF